MQPSSSRRHFLRSVTAAGMGTALSGTLGHTAWAASRQDDTLQGVPAPAANRVRALVQQFMKQFDIPGMSLAMAIGGQLKVVGGFGWADREAGTVVQPNHRFRIASVSKPVTSAAIMKLVENRKLKLNDRVLGRGGILESLTPEKLTLNQQASRWLSQVNVQHLLEHTAGGWGNRRNDPMFVRAALEQDHAGLIDWTIRNQPLENAPGSNYSYSNFGYCLLGRVIEQKTGMDYEKAVQQLILVPAGAESMQVGGDRLADRAENEVRYYGQEGEDPYHRIMRVRRMDAHGGWIATASDLVRFVLHVDGFDRPRDLIGARTIKTMTTASAANPNYAKGWSVNKSNNWWHQGSFNGGTAILARIHDQYSWAVVVNTRPKAQGYGSALDKLPWDIRRALG